MNVVVRTSEGAAVDIESLACSLAYDNKGNVASRTWTDGYSQWQMSFSYDENNRLLSHSALAKVKIKRKLPPPEVEQEPKRDVEPLAVAAPAPEKQAEEPVQPPPRVEPRYPIKWS